MTFSVYHAIDDDFIIDGKRFKRNASFDNILKVIELSKDDSIDNLSKLMIGLFMLFDIDNTEVHSLTDMVYKIEEVFGAEYDAYDLHKIYTEAVSEYIESKNDVEYDDLGNEVPKVETGEDKKLMDIDHDAQAIYSSFMQAYGIDLHEQLGKLHWYKFKALLSGLPEKTRMREIVSIRGYKKPSKNDDYHVQMMRLQHEYALPVEDAEWEDDELGY